MKRIILAAALFATSFVFSFGQKSQLITGNNKLVDVETLADLQNFDQLDIEGVPGGKGTVTIRCGSDKPKLSIKSDENLAKYFMVVQEGKKLYIGLPDNKNNKLWIEDTSIDIEIEVPSLDELRIESNLNCTVTGIDNKKFSLVKSNNGNIALEGNAKHLSIRKTGNGNVDAQQLETAECSINSMGNGDVRVQATQSLKTDRTGNGNIYNTGDAKAKKGLNMGNGQTLDKGEEKKTKKWDD
jgi:hypothetical protein